MISFTMIYLAHFQIKLLVDIFRNFNHITHPIIITVTVLFFVFLLTGIIIGKFFRINSWLIFLPYFIFYILAIQYYFYQFRLSNNSTLAGYVFPTWLFPIFVVGFLLALPAAIAYLITILIFKNECPIYVTFGIQLGIYVIL